MLGNAYRQFLLAFSKSVSAVNRSVFPANFPLAGKPVESILVIHPQLLGDTLAVTPLLAQLRANFPRARIALVTNPVCAGLFPSKKYVDELLFYDEHKSSFSDFASLVSQIRKRNFSVVLDCQVTLSNFKRSLLSPLSGAPVRVGFVRGGFSGVAHTFEVPVREAHAIDTFLSLLQPLGVKTVYQSRVPPVLEISRNDLAWAKARLGRSRHPLIGIHFGNKSPAKRWPLEKFAEVAKALRKSGASVVLTGSSEDRAQADELVSLLDFKPTDLVGKSSIGQYCAAISLLDLLVSVDTSAVHIAAARNVPTVAIYGSTNLKYWGPENPKNQIALQHSCKYYCEEPDFSRILPVSLKCDLDYPCIRSISVEEVLAAAKKLLKRR